MIFPVSHPRRRTSRPSRLIGSGTVGVLVLAFVGACSQPPLPVSTSADAVTDLDIAVPDTVQDICSGLKSAACPDAVTVDVWEVVDSTADTDLGAVDATTKLPDEIALEDFATAAAQQWCHVWHDAPGAPLSERCKREVGFSVYDTVHDRLQLVVLGRLLYNPKAAKKCVEQMNLENRLDVQNHILTHMIAVGGRGPVPPECDQIFEGTTKLGSPCDDGVECLPGLRCWGCPGVCIVPSAVGGPCDATAGCALGDICDNGTCVAGLSAGQGEPCHDKGNLCDENLYARCNTCKLGLTCMQSDKAGVGTCEPVASLPIGATCVNGGFVDRHECVSGAVCDATNHCVDTPAVGTPCLFAIDCGPKQVCSGVAWSEPPWSSACHEPGHVCEVSCPADARCDSNTTCDPWTKLGDACVPGVQFCDGDTQICDPTTAKCVPAPVCPLGCPSLGCVETGVCYTPMLGESCTPEFMSIISYPTWPWGIECVNGVARRHNPACEFVSQ